MSVVVSTSEIKLTETDAGVLRIGDTRVSLDSVIAAFLQGATPEQIVFDYDTLSLSDVYAAISYYLQHSEEVDSYLANRAQQNRELRESNDARFDHIGIRARLLARRQEQAPAKRSAGKFQIFKSSESNFRFNLVAANGQIILSSETYESKAAAVNGIESIKSNAANPQSFIRKTSARGESYFLLQAANGRIIAQSEMYSSESAAEKGIEAVKEYSLSSAIEDRT